MELLITLLGIYSLFLLSLTAPAYVRMKFYTIAKTLVQAHVTPTTS